MCGEQSRGVVSEMCHPGSPPRVRGTDSEQVVSGIANGITPACAGNSNFAGHAFRCPADHPRVCGEQIDDNPTDGDEV